MSKKYQKRYDGNRAESSSTNNDNNFTLPLSKKRFLTVSEYHHKVLVDIREYYINDDGERRPGRKGISLSIEDWNKITENIDVIEKEIKKKSGDDDDDEDDGGDGDKVAKKADDNDDDD